MMTTTNEPPLAHPATGIHDTDTCRLGPDGGPCTMCVWVIQQERKQRISSCCDECDDADRRELEQVAAAVVGTVFDNTGASAETLKRTMIERIADHLRDSPALRRTRSIVHHAEMVKEQKRREICGECHHPNNTDLHGRCQEVISDPVDGSTVYCGCKCIFPDTAASDQIVGQKIDPVTTRSILDAVAADKAIDALGSDVQHQRLTTPSSFDAAWDAAPESMRRVTEIEAAEFFYYAGRRDRETELLAEMNETLKGVVERIGAEGRK